jgi:hypothetical protein
MSSLLAMRFRQRGKVSRSNHSEEPLRANRDLGRASSASVKKGKVDIRVEGQRELHVFDLVV